MKRNAERHRFYSDLARKLKPILPPRETSWIDRRQYISRCIFCGGSPTNREHIWPAWSHTYLPKGVRLWYGIHAVRRITHSDINIDKRSIDPYDRQVKAVDEKCNNGWMRQTIEEPAKDVLIRLFTGNGNPTRITSVEQAHIASWIALRIMISEFDHYSQRITHHMHRKMLWKTQSISETNWRVWIGNYEGRNASSLWIQNSFLLVPERVAAQRKSNKANYANGQTLTYVIGKLVIHAMYCPDPVALRLWNLPALVNGKYLRVWPLTDLSIKWPPVALTDDEVHFAAGAFQNFLLDAVARRKAAPRFSDAVAILGDG